MGLRVSIFIISILSSGVGVANQLTPEEQALDLGTLSQENPGADEKSLEEKSVGPRTLLDGSTNLVEKRDSLLKLFAPETRQAIQTYMKVARPSAYRGDREITQGNKGVEVYFEKIFNDPKNYCLAAKAEVFHSDILELDPYEFNAPPLEDPLAGRPSLLSRAEKMGFEAGWAWKMAMLMSEGDPNQAMLLIGVCGHDDVAANYVQGSDQSKSVKLPAEFPQLNGYFTCGSRTSPLFLPGSLSKDADISQKLKDKIAKLQAPTLGPKVIPAKYYHVYMGAFMSCQMIEDGVSARGAPSYPPKFVSAYRRNALCAMAREYKAEADKANAFYQNELKRRLRAGQDPIDPVETLFQKREEVWDEIESGVAYDIRNLGREKFKVLINRIFAGKLFFEQQQCPSSSLGEWKEGARALSATSLNAFDYGRPFVCSGIPQGLCLGAQEILDTWRVDFEWTSEQHRLGAEFGAKHCRKKSDRQRPSRLGSEVCQIPDSYLRAMKQLKQKQNKRSQEPPSPQKGTN